MSIPRPTRPTFAPKIREAWGYNDALLHDELGIVAEWRRGSRDTHFDMAYVRGYYRGMDDAKSGTHRFECGLVDCTLCVKGECK